jgi:hypothetical protein
MVLNWNSESTPAFSHPSEGGECHSAVPLLRFPSFGGVPAGRGGKMFDFKLLFSN